MQPTNPATLLGKHPTSRHSEPATPADAPRDEHAASGRERQKSPSSGPHEPGNSRELFRKFAHRTSYLVGTPGAFFAAVAIIGLWLVSGPLFHFSDTWQLIINTSTTIVTFLMVFLIQTTQNRDAAAMHLKLDELIRATRTARNDLVALEQMSDAELKQLEQQFEELRNKACTLRKSHSDLGKA